MTSLHNALRRGVVALAACGVVAGGVAGCAGPTNLTVEQSEGPFALEIAMDPQTLNPPQLTTLNFTILDRMTDEPVTSFTPVFGALLHNVLISRDLLHFEHSYTGRASQAGFSVLTNFRVTGEYINHTYFQPAGAELQHVRSEIATGSVHMQPNLVADPTIPRFSQGVQHDLILGPDPIRAGRPAQLALLIRERGEPVTELDTFLAGPGLMFVTSEDGEHFAIEQGAARGHVNATAASTPGTPQGTGTVPTRPTGTITAVPTRPASGSTPGAEQQQASQQANSAAGTPPPAPTLVPDVASALATITAQPIAPLAPVQQTAMASVFDTPAVLPAVSYGPYVAFTHTFPEPGLYKLWFETSYRQHIMEVDFVVRVQE